MDPLSISVSAVSLAGAAAKLSLWLYDVIESTSKIDSTVLSLSKEVKSLEGSLKSLDQTLQECRSQALVLMHMNDDIWRSIESNLLDCRETLEELTTLVGEVKRPSSSRNIFRKPNVALRLSLRKKEIGDFQDKIHKSNASMQTAVGVVSLSLALRQNVSQEMLMRELQRLRGLVENTMRVARTSNTSYPAAARMSRNIEGLVQAAQRFHSSASSTASTRYGGTRRRPYGTSWLGSDAGSLTDYDRDRIQAWKSGLRLIDEGTDTASTVDTRPSGTGTTSTTDRETDVTTPEPEDEDEDDLELDLEIFQNAEELGRMSFGNRDYNNAEKFLNKALSGATGTSSNPDHFGNLKLQLSICYCFQAKWREAEAVLLTLGKRDHKANLPVFHLLHAVALAHLADEKYDRAYNACKRSLQGKKKAHGGKTNQDYIDSLALLAAICEVRGEPIEAAAIRHSIPENRMQEGFPDPEEFIRSHGSIIERAFGKGFADGNANGNEGRVVEEEEDEEHDHLSEADDVGRTEQDTGKEVGGGDHDASLSARVSNWDTGKEILSVQRGGHMTINPVTHKRIFSTVKTFDDETGQILAWADWDTCTWIKLSTYWDHFAESMIHELLVDEQSRLALGLPCLAMKDEDKHSDLMVVDVERIHDAITGSDSQKEVWYPYAAPVPESSRFPNAYAPGPSGSLRPHYYHEYEPEPSQYGGLGRYEHPYFVAQSDEHLGISASGQGPPTISRTLADDFSSTVYISEPRGGGVTSAPPLHTNPDNHFLSPFTPPPRPSHHPSRSVDMIPRQFESNNPFRRAASQRSLNNLATSSSSSVDRQGLRKMASFEQAVYVPPMPWTARRYGNSRESPRILQTPAVFLRDVPDGKTDGLILGINLGLEAIEVTVSFEDGSMSKCPGTLHLNQAGKNPSDLPWFDCLSTVASLPSSTPLGTPTEPSFPASADPCTLATHPYNLLQMLQLHALQTQSCLDTFVSSTSTSIPLPAPSAHSDAASALEGAFSRIQSGLARWIASTKNDFFLAWTPLDEIVFAVPDALLAMPSAKAKVLDMLGRNELFRHAKVTAASTSVVWWFLKKQEHLNLKDIGATASAHAHARTRVQALVVQCGHLLCEVARYDIVSENGAVIVRPVGETKSLLCGSLHVELRFAQLAHEKLTSTISRFKMRLGGGRLLELVRTCSTQFRQHLLHQDMPDDRFVVTSLDVPSGFPGLENGRLAFSRYELMTCFEPVVARVEDLLASDRLDLDPLSYVFVAGSFACSDWVLKRIQRWAVSMGSPKVCIGQDCTSYGAVLQAKQLDFVNLQTS